ncbi:MAG: DUF2785 domain-containing protein [Pseudomonadota bacterium]
MRFLLTIVGAFALHNAAMAACPPAGITRADILALQAVRGEVADHARRQRLAIGLTDCLSSPDPELRERSSQPSVRIWIREQKLDVSTLHNLRVSQVAAIKQHDPAGFAQAFAALVLADLVGADSVKPFLGESHLAEIMQAGTTYLSGLRDYRGYDQKEGWRHAVPHASDLLTQLARHQGIGKKNQQIILEAIATQLYAAGSQTPPQFYQYSEGSRMARTVFSLAERSEITVAEWDAWFGAFVVTTADRNASKPELFARRHNFRSFLMPLYISLLESKDMAQRERVLASVSKALQQFGAMAAG